MKKTITVFLFCNFLLIFPSFASSVVPLIVKENDKLYSGYSFAEVIKVEKNDNVHPVIFESGKFDSLFVPADSFEISIKDQRHAYWFKLKIKNNLDNLTFFYMPNYGIQNISFYYKTGNSFSKEFKSGRIPLDQKLYKDAVSIFPIEAPKDSLIELYLYVSGTNLARQQFFICSSPAKASASLHNNTFQGVFYGFMIVILIYNLLLYFLAREKIYLFYGLVVLGTILRNSIFYGHAEIYLWPSNPEIMKYSDVFLSLSIIPGIYFIFEFLEIKRVSKILHVVGYVLLGLLFINIVLELAGEIYDYYVFFNSGLIGQIILLYGFISSFISLYKGVKNAIFFIVSRIFMVPGYLIYFAFCYGKLPYLFFTYNAATIAAATEVILFTVALSWKVNQYKRQKEAEELLKIMALEENQQLIKNQNIVLEEQVESRTSELINEKQKSDDLLHNILPIEIANELKIKGKSEARLYESVTVLFTDFVNFTGIGEKLSPNELVSELDKCFRAYDEIIEKYKLEKIKTIGDAYLAVSGLPQIYEDHGIRAINAAIEIQNYMKEYQNQGGVFKVRIGLHSGPVIAGIVGSKKFAFDIWGNTVNMAARMEQNSESGKINISADLYQLVKGKVRVTPRGMLDVKNKGNVEMYFVEGII